MSGFLEPSFLTSFGVEGNSNSEFKNPIGITFVSDLNEIFIADYRNHRIQVFDLDGKFISTFGSQGSEPGQFYNQHDIVFDNENRMFIVDSGNNRVQILSLKGESNTENDGFSSVKSKILPPKKQLDSGVPSNKILCKEGFELVFKKNSKNPACVKTITVNKLIERGWI